MADLSEPRERVVERFWARVRRSDECWVWTGAAGRRGYGRLGVEIGGRSKTLLQASHISWEIHAGPIPDGLCVCHHCDNPPCVRPDHLFVGTLSDNARDRERKGRGRSQYLFGASRGSSNYNAKLNEDDVRRIQSLRSQGLTIARIAEQFPVAEKSIGSILSGHQWTHLTGIAPGRRPPCTEGIGHRPGRVYCKAGHRFSSENTYVDRRGHRNCRSCNTAAVARYRVRLQTGEQS